MLTGTQSCELQPTLCAGRSPRFVININVRAAWTGFNQQGGGLWGEPAQQRKQLIGGARLAGVAFHLSTCGVIWNSMPRVCANSPTRFGGTDPLSSYITSSFENGLEDCAPAEQENANVQNMETRVCRVFN
jgi:hypothetical protein